MFLLAVIWLAFGVLHSLLADLKVKAWFEKRLGTAFKYYRLAYNAVFLFLLGITIWLSVIQPKDATLFKVGVPVIAIAALLAVIGLVIMVASLAKFDMGEFVGWAYLRPAKEKQQLETLRTDGLYRFVRHPLYFGTFVFVAGLFLFWPTAINLLSVGFLYAYTYTGALLEERKLEKIFGSDYSKYKKKVKMLVPYIF